MAISPASGWFQIGSGTALWMPEFIALTSRCLCAPRAASLFFPRSAVEKRTSLRAQGRPYANGKRNCTGGPDAVRFPG